MKKTFSIRFIERQPELDEYCHELAQANRIALDTEFIGEGLYYPKLCLIQVATDFNATVALIDPLQGLQFDEFIRILSNSEVELVFHAARQDIDILTGQLHVNIHRLFDTQVAAAFLGYGDQPALTRLMMSELGIKIEKGERFTDWSIRPLSQAQLEYAAMDVAHLIEIRNRLEQQLLAKHRWGWFYEESVQILARDRSVDESELWRRVSDRRGLKRRELGILQELALLREHTAQHWNKPREYVIPDRVMVQVSRTNIHSEQDLKTLRGWRAPNDSKFLQAILQTIDKAKAKPEDEYPREEFGTAMPVEASAVSDLLSAWLKIVSERIGVSSPLLAVRAELDAVSRWGFERKGSNPPPVRFVEGWRLEVLGKNLLEIASGKKSIGLFSDQEDVLSIGRK
ncbi:MAG: ribonuclease D [bacterium]|nr:ribonuclease D [bacterium]